MLWIDNLAARTVVRFKQGGGVSHGDILRGLSHFQADIHALTGVYDQIEIIGRRSLKTGSFDLYLIGAHMTVYKFIVAVIVRLSLKHNAGLYVIKSDRGSGHGAIRWIVDGAQNGPRFELTK